MAMNTCPNCEIKLTRGEMNSGACPSCRSPLERATSGTRPTQRTAAKRDDGPAKPTGICELTGQRATDLRRAYLRVAKTTVGVSGAVRLSYVNVAVNCSAAALRKGRGIVRNSILIGMSWLILAIGGMGLLCLLEAVGVSQNVIRMLVPPVFLSVPVLLLAALVVMPVYRRRRLNSLFAEPLNATLKQIGGCNDWGFRNSVGFAKRLPKSESSIPASMLQSIHGAGARLKAMI